MVTTEFTVGLTKFPSFQIDVTLETDSYCFGYEVGFPNGPQSAITWTLDGLQL